MADGAEDQLRPVTSKARGICRYYNTPRGCYAGDRCRFLHGATERLTPYDKNKVCRYHLNGYCKHGEKCWFKHADPSKTDLGTEEPSDNDLCAICYDKPVTYGLLLGCSHVFCISCIKSWRGAGEKSSDIVEAGTTKTCPMCRTPSRFVTPSTIFVPEGDCRKSEIIEGYKASMSRVKCKYFEKSPVIKRFCPFGDDCFYLHEGLDGKAHKFNYRVEDMQEVSIMSVSVVFALNLMNSGYVFEGKTTPSTHGVPA
ncbi:uncharacterized protein BXZ73DRAFT_45332 [Epithele typhae]|uniref:uncharacterized protein n=1 Tax=Epithele typhae TaxID=378194 RepID=UPI002008041B|nr:uncharacterized protein BXZ73DRAFT_45332 [Epithele typhae]KAH9935942.1 hypothetical protein BXZ73DRAFT_45332 [Epithele typhae]